MTPTVVVVAKFANFKGQMLKFHQLTPKFYFTFMETTPSAQGSSALTRKFPRGHFRSRRLK